MKRKFVTDKFLNTEVTITPKQLGDAISKAAKREEMIMPPELRGCMVPLLLSFGASIMTQLLVEDLGLDPEEQEKTENEAD